ncbi:MAG TPA: hypothetical protein VKT52_13480 [Ktedonobacterales bacterium]|nr:hypothetical protein [Ktedonobacterales bacterium]
MVERDFAWHGQSRRLRKDEELLVQSSEAKLSVRMIRLTQR